MAESAQSLIFNGVDWRPLAGWRAGADPDWENHQDRAAIEVYARGTASIGKAEPGNCTGFLIDDSTVVTAAHCLLVACDEDLAVPLIAHPDGPETQCYPRRIQARFGQIAGPEQHWGELNWTVVESFTGARIRERLVELGYKAGWAMSPDLELTPFVKVQCEFLHADDAFEGDVRDIAYYDCAPLEFDDEYGDRDWINPGAFWGRLPISDAVYRGRPAGAVGWNQRERLSTANEMLLGFAGKVLDERVECRSSELYDQCFAFSADTRCGHSGGPIFDERQRAVVGVFNGSNWRDEPDGGECSWESIPDANSVYYNTATRFGEAAFRFADPGDVTPVRIRTKPGELEPRDGAGDWRPRDEDRRARLVCPEDMFAAGLLLREQVDAEGLTTHVRELGLACRYVTAGESGWDSHSDVVLVADPRARATVLEFPYHVARAELLSTSEGVRPHFDEVLCRPGSTAIEFGWRLDRRGLLHSLSGLMCDPLPAHREALEVPAGGVALLNSAVDPGRATDDLAGGRCDPAAEIMIGADVVFGAEDSIVGFAPICAGLAE